jgi:hypothetical protein
MVVDLCTPLTSGGKGGGVEMRPSGVVEEASEVVAVADEAAADHAGRTAVEVDDALQPAEGRRRRLAAPVAADPAAEAAALQLLDVLVRGTDRWLLHALEGLAARASRLVHRRRREEDRVAAIKEMSDDLVANL